MKKPIYLALLFLASVFNAPAQAPIVHTTFLKIQISANNPPPNNLTASVETIKPMPPSTDSFYAVITSNRSAITTLMYRDSAVYEISTNDTIKIFDYTLGKNDTFSLVPVLGPVKKFVVQSVSSYKLEDQSNTRAFYLADLDQKVPNLIWLEGYGELTYGWNYRILYAQSHSPFVNGICRHDNGLVYWLNDTIETVKINKTCDFGSIEKAVAIEDVQSRRFRSYPNPSTSILTIEINEHNTSAASTFRVFSSLGVEVRVPIYSTNSGFNLETSGLPDGHYTFVIQNNSGIQRGSFVVAH